MAREVWVEKLMVLSFATDSLRSNVRVILQYSVKLNSCCNYMLCKISQIRLAKSRAINP